MQVDESRRDVIAAYVDGSFGLIGGNVFGDASNLVTRDGDVRHAVDVVGGINDMTAFEDVVVLLP